MYSSLFVLFALAGQVAEQDGTLNRFGVSSIRVGFAYGPTFLLYSNILDEPNPIVSEPFRSLGFQVGFGNELNMEYTLSYTIVRSGLGFEYSKFESTEFGVGLRYYVAGKLTKLFADLVLGISLRSHCSSDVCGILPRPDWRVAYGVSAFSDEPLSVELALFAQSLFVERYSEPLRMSALFGWTVTVAYSVSREI